jgi:hypothetical protein
MQQNGVKIFAVLTHFFFAKKCCPKEPDFNHKKQAKVKQSCPATRPVGARKERYSSHYFLTSALEGVSGQRHVPATLYPREWTHDTHWIGGWVGLRAGLDTEATEKYFTSTGHRTPVEPDPRVGPD